MQRFLLLPILALSFCAMSLVIAADDAVKGPENFKLKAVDGKTEFELAKAKGKYVALHFLLKTECPLCLRHTQTYAKRAKEVPNTEQIFIKPDTVEEIQAWASKFDLDDETTPKIYRDPDAKLAKEYDIPFGYEFHGQVVHYPAFILLDKEGKEVFRFVGKSNRERFEFDKFKEMMETMD